jgi:hypothetical protein
MQRNKLDVLARFMQVDGGESGDTVGFIQNYAL